MYNDETNEQKQNEFSSRSYKMKNRIESKEHQANQVSVKHPPKCFVSSNILHFVLHEK